MASAVLRSSAFLLVSSFFAACSSFSEADSPDDAGSTPPTDAGSSDGSTTMETGADAAAGADAGAFFVLGTNFSNLRDVVADDQWAYVAEQSPGGVHAVPLPGNSQSPRSLPAPAPTALGVTGNSLFWFDNNDGALHMWDPTVPRTTSNPETKPIAAIALGGSYLVSLVKRDSGGNAGSIQARPQTMLGNAFQTVSSTNPFDVAMHGNDAYWTDIGAIRHLLIDGTGSGTADDFAPCPDGDCEYITASDVGVFWTRTATNAVAGKTTSGSMTSLGATEPSPSAIASDASGVYWIVSDGRVRRWSAAGGQTVDISSGFPVLQDIGARALALTSKYVIWLAGDGRILAHSK